jgi:hypothetical protein
MSIHLPKPTKSALTVLGLALMALPLSLRASSIIDFGSLSGWNAAVGGATTSYDFTLLPGNNTPVDGITVAGVTFNNPDGSLVSCGGVFPSDCTGTGGILIGQPTIIDTLPSGTLGAAGDFGTYYGNSPDGITITATSLSGATDSITLDAGTSSVFKGFVSTDPSDPLVTISVTSNNGGYYAAQFDGDYTTPEPAAGALLFGGLALIALKGRRWPKLRSLRFGRRSESPSN